MILNENKLLENLTKKNCKKQIKKNLEFEKQSSKKGDKLYVKWKGYNNFFKAGSIKMT